MFLNILGCEAGFMGLRLLATGGVYICGGIGPKARMLLTRDRMCGCSLRSLGLSMLHRVPRNERFTFSRCQ